MMHYSVLLNESIDGLNIKSDGIYVDATLGLGGHSSKILEKLTKGHLYSFDEDGLAIKESDNRLSKINNNYTLIKSNFVNMKSELEKLGVYKVDGILFDLGVSSPQIDNASRGFSFMQDAKLDMRMDQSSDFSAYDVVNQYSYDKLKDIFYKYGEEKMSAVIAKNIVNLRPINTTLDLVEIIKKSVGLKYYNLNHPERKIFQAIRIEVNHELDVLEKVLPDVLDLLNVGGRCAIITFHSLEDRIVKNFFKDNSELDELVNGLPNDMIPDEYKCKLKIINKKVILADKKELEENSRSKSAKLRIVERI